MKKFDLAKLARVEPIVMASTTRETVAFYAGVVGGLCDEKLAVDYLEVARYADGLPPAKQPD